MRSFFSFFLKCRGNDSSVCMWHKDVNTGMGQGLTLTEALLQIIQFSCEHRF